MPDSSYYNFAQSWYARSISGSPLYSASTHKNQPVNTGHNSQNNLSMISQLQCDPQQWLKRYWPENHTEATFIGERRHCPLVPSSHHAATCHVTCQFIGWNSQKLSPVPDQHLFKGSRLIWWTGESIAAHSVIPYNMSDGCSMPAMQ